jgi:gluconokinase
VCGVSGAGKSTVGRALADRLGWVFEDADDFHPESNVRKMAAGIPLTDEDRAPWLALLARRLQRPREENTGRVLACSVLKRAYREILARDLPSVIFALLQVPEEILRERLRRRQGHFMPASLLDSQFAVLELPAPGENAVVIDAAGTVEETVEAIVQKVLPRSISKK